MQNSSLGDDKPIQAEDVVAEHPERSAPMVAIKRLVQFLFLLLITPRLLFYWLTKALIGDRAFLAASESIARIPGIRGVYCRQAFYACTLERAGKDCSLGWLSTFSMPQASIGDNV